MTTPFTTPIRLIASLCPSIPLAFEVHSRFREPKQVTCPETGEPAAVQVDAKMACEIDQLMKITAELKMPAVAMTDHGNLFGAVQFYNAAKASGVHPVIGCEVYVSQKGHKTRSDTDRYNHLVLLCENQEGYRNLINLVSTAYLDGFYYKPRIDMDLLSQHSNGLIGMSACLRGHIPETILSDKHDDARRM